MVVEEAEVVVVEEEDDDDDDGGGRDACRRCPGCSGCFSRSCKEGPCLSRSPVAGRFLARGTAATVSVSPRL